jgi:hypothetical protein
VRLDTWRQTIESAAPAAKQEKMDQLTTRVTAILEKVGVEPTQERLLQETAILADKLDVSEELTRLAGHLERLTSLTRNGGEIGKKARFPHPGGLPRDQHLRQQGPEPGYQPGGGRFQAPSWKSAESRCKNIE